MSVIVRIPTPLRKVTNGADKAEVEAGSLSSIMSSLNTQFPGIQERLCNEDGSLRSFVNIYINGEDVRFLDGLSSEANSGDEVSIVPAVAGGNY